jgi:hypothetical protein
MSALIEYFEALERLKKGTPLIVPKNTKISKDSVSLEAGRQKGTIKKSRPIFKQLIDAIDEAALEQQLPALTEREKLIKVKTKLENYRTLYEAAVAREIMLVRRIYELEAYIAESTNSNVAIMSQKNRQ